MGWTKKLVVVGAIAACGVLATGAPAGAGGSSIDIDLDPELECIFPLEKGGYVALFGYENGTKVPATVAIGNRNKFSPKPVDRGQPTTFAPGRHVGVFTVEFDGSGAIVWHLDNRTANANKNSRKCEEPPVPVGTGSTQSFVWLAVAAGAIVIVGGGSGTAWFMRKRRAT
jgi:hypothetical protein